MCATSPMKTREAQRADVEDVLAALGVEEAGEQAMIEALNKIDLLDEEEKLTLQQLCRLSEEKGRMARRVIQSALLCRRKPAKEQTTCCA